MLEISKTRVAARTEPRTPPLQPGSKRNGPAPDRTNSAHASGLALVVLLRCRPHGSWLASRAGAQALCCRPRQVGSARLRIWQVKRTNSTALPEQLELPGIDFSLWDEQRVKAYQTVRSENILKFHWRCCGFPGFLLRLRSARRHRRFDFEPRSGTHCRYVTPRRTRQLGIAGHRDGFSRT